MIRTIKNAMFSLVGLGIVAALGVATPGSSHLCWMPGRTRMPHSLKARPC